MPSPEEHIVNYIAMRDKCTAIRREADKKIAAIKEKMAAVEHGFAANVLVEGKMNSITTDSGRAHVETRHKYYPDDRGAFTNFILKQPEERLHLIELRPLQKACKMYTEEHDECPDGLSVLAERKVIITRKT